MFKADLDFLFDVGLLPCVFAALYPSLQILNPQLLLFIDLLLVVGLGQEVLQPLQILRVVLDCFQQIIKLLLIGYLLLNFSTVVLPDQTVRQQLLRGRSLVRVDLQQPTDHISQIIRVGHRNAFEQTGTDLLVESLEVIRSEGRLEGCHLIEHAAQRPHIAFGVVRLVLPDFRARVVRSTGLGEGHILLEHLGDVEIAQLVDVIGGNEHIGALQVAVEYLAVVERMQSLGHMHHGLPDLVLLVPRPALDVHLVAFQDVAARRELHDHAEGSRDLVVEGFLVPNYVLVVVGGQNADLVQRIVPLLLLHCPDLHLA